MFDFAKELGNEFPVSLVRLNVTDMRTGGKLTKDIYRFGKFFDGRRAGCALAAVGFRLDSYEIVDTQYGEISLKSIYEAFRAAEEEKSGDSVSETTAQVAPVRKLYHGKQ